MKETVLLEMINRYGTRAVLGRDVLRASEIIRMNYCQNITAAYQARSQTEGWIEWIKRNPELAKALKDAEKIANA